MLRSMFSGVSGLRSHQTMMDVTGNNIANVNTAGYKSSRTTFQEALTQVARGATGAAPVAGGAGGVNPLQLGLGATVAAVDGVFTQGATQVTGRATDLAIQGNGFFVVVANGQQLYTRAGAFSFDGEGFLVGPAGERVQGYPPGGGAALGDIQVAPNEFIDVVIGKDGGIVGRRQDGTQQNLGTVALATFANPGGLERVGGSLFSPTANSGAIDITPPGMGATGTLQAGVLEMSNVDLAQEFTNLILAQRGFQANARTITSSDEMLSELVNLKR